MLLFSCRVESSINLITMISFTPSTLKKSSSAFQIGSLKGKELEEGPRLDLGCCDISAHYFHGRKTTKLDGQKYLSLQLSFHNLFRSTTFRYLRGIGKTLSLPECCISESCIFGKRRFQ